MTADIEIDGVLGFYSISGGTEEGRQWIAEQVQGGENGYTHSDDRRLAENVADGALNDGLTVNVNDHKYLGNGYAAA